MATTVNFTTTHPTVQHAEFVRKGATGLELVKEVLGIVFLIPIRPKVTRLETGLLIGHEPDPTRSILVNYPNGETKAMVMA